MKETFASPESIFINLNIVLVEVLLLYVHGKISIIMSQPNLTTQFLDRLRTLSS